jgi:hypothetical protein
LAGADAIKGARSERYSNSHTDSLSQRHTNSDALCGTKPIPGRASRSLVTYSITDTVAIAVATPGPTLKSHDARMGV